MAACSVDKVTTPCGWILAGALPSAGAVLVEETSGFPREVFSSKSFTSSRSLPNGGVATLEILDCGAEGEAF